MTVLETFKTHLADFEQWRYNIREDENVCLNDPDYVVKSLEPGINEEIGSQWWGNLLGKKHETFRYSLVCKGKEVYSIPVVYYRVDELMTPFPKTRTLLDPRDGNEFGIECFCDLLYYDTESLEYGLLAFFRNGEALHSPLESHIKPGIIRLPFLFFSGNHELEVFSNAVQQRLGEFPEYMDEKQNKRRPPERLFSEWVLEISSSLRD